MAKKSHEVSPVDEAAENPEAKPYQEEGIGEMFLRTNTGLGVLAGLIRVLGVSGVFAAGVQSPVQVNTESASPVYLAQTSGGARAETPAAEASAPTEEPTDPTAAKFSRLYKEIYGRYYADEILEPELIGLIRTNGVQDREPQGEIDVNQPVQIGEEVTVFFAVAIPEGKGGIIRISWLHGGKAYEGTGGKAPKDYPASPSPRYRMWTRAQFYEPGRWTMVVTMGEQELVRQGFTVVSSRLPVSGTPTNAH